MFIPLSIWYVKPQILPQQEPQSARSSEIVQFLSYFLDRRCTLPSFQRQPIFSLSSVPKMTDTGEYHGYIIFISYGDYVFIPYRASGLDNGSNTMLDG